MQFSRLSVDRDAGFPVGEVDAQPVRMPVTGLGLAGRDVHVEDANEGIVENELVRVARNAQWIQRVICLAEGGPCHDTAMTSPTTVSGRFT